MDDRLTAEIVATCDNIGYADKDKYYKDENCITSVKDLLLYLRRDDDDHSVLRLLGQAQVLQRDLLPLIKHHSEDLELYNILLRLLVTLTHPVLLLYDEEVPKNKKYLTQYLQIEQHLRDYKNAFVDKLLWKRLTDRLGYLLNLEWDKRMEDDTLALERILLLIRNILTVSSDPAEERRTDDENSLHDRLLMVMHLSGIEDLLLFVASSESTREYCLHVLEIISLMLREQTGEQVAKTKLTRNEEDTVKDERELIQIQEKEAVLRSIQLKKLSTRHSRFGGTFTVRDMKAPSGRDLLCHKPISSTSDLSLDATKKTKKTASNRRPMNEDDSTRRSTIPVRIVLKEFCSDFLDGAYNSIMQVVKDNLNRGKTQDHDETYYLWAMKFFMEFNRYHKFRVSYVSETMSTTAFHYVQTLLDNYHGMMVTDKEKIPYWSRRAHMALKAYQELLYTLLWMDQYGKEAVKESSRVIKTNVFYLPEYRELCYSLLNTYDPVKLSKSYLKDLIETNHLFLKMLEEFSSSNRRVIVKTKGKKRKKAKNSKKAKKSRREKGATTMDEEELEELWTTVSGEISSALLLTELPDGEEAVGDGNVNVIPFDAASDIPIDEQKVTAVERIAAFLHSKKYNEAVALFRASREVWPEITEEFGGPGMEASDEILVLKSIFVEKASLPAVSTALREMEEPASDEENQENEEDEFEEEEEEEEIRVASKEQEFDFFGFLLKYATPKIVCNYAKLFKDWESLKPFTLHCVMKMFHRFVFQMEYPALICQASIFRTFQKILQIADHQPDLKDVVKFFYHFWPKFVKLCETNKTMFVEILFWKTSNEAREIQDGYGSYSSNANKPSKNSWTTEEENELVLLAEEYSNLPDEVKRATKMVDWIRERWTWRPKSKKMMMNKLVEKEIMDNVVRTTRAPAVWGDAEIEKLRELYDEFKDSNDIMGNILSGLEVKRSKNKVIAKMLEIELIRDKSEVKKKRVRGQRKKRNRIAEDESGREGDEMERSETQRRPSVSSGSESSNSDRSDSESEQDDHDEININSSHTDVKLDSNKAMQFGKELIKEGAIGPIRWVFQSLKYFLDDLCDEPDSDESVPLVPIGNESISAMSKSNMKAFLKSIGLQPPGLQETFWRIPGAWNQANVNSRIQLLQKIIDSETSEAPSVSNTKPIDASDDDLDDVPRSRIKPVQSSTDEKEGDSIHISGAESTNGLSQTSNTSRQSRSRKSSISSSSSSSSSSSGSLSTTKSASQISKSTSQRSKASPVSKQKSPNNTPKSDDKSHKNRSRIVIESDSEDDNVNTNSNVASDMEHSPVKSVIANRIDSDDDEKDSDTEKVSKKAKSKVALRIVDSSDED